MKFKIGDIVVVDNFNKPKFYGLNAKYILKNYNLVSDLEIYTEIRFISEITLIAEKQICIKIDAISRTGRPVTGAWGLKENFRKATDREKLLYYTHGENVLRRENEN